VPSRPSLALMLDLRPVGYVIGLLVAILGVTMLAPMLLDIALGNGHAGSFLESAALTILFGVLLALTCSNSVRQGLTIQQTFLLTTLVWLALPVFGAIPFMVGATELSFTDAFFEAMSGLTTTGSTVINGLDTLPQGLLLWRGILQWLGGIGIIVVAMVFLPELRVGGMQIFKSEGFDTFGKILPRATQISSRISVIYVSLTVLCALAYLIAGMSVFDAVVHAMTTVATGGFANYDSSFAALPDNAEYIAVGFMMLAALPFVRFVQLLAGGGGALLRDAQIRGFFITAFVLDPDGNRVRECGLHALGGVPGGVAVFYRADRWLRGLDRLFDQDLPISASVCGHRRAVAPHPVAQRGVCHPL